jgi:hypothetical protein
MFTIRRYEPTDLEADESQLERRSSNHVWGSSTKNQGSGK